MSKVYMTPLLVKRETLSAVTAGANFSGKKAKPT
ncbi:putative RiPP precursor [Starkeya sp. ORNL1]|nr:putative RiPP precursor [Starkeya sp. ORNL1]QJP14271.1 putative RiPP precursor [Starkeya sp. ORNL1]